MAWSSDGWSAASVVASGTYVNAEVNALAANIIPAPPVPWLNAADTLVTSLKTAGVWAELDLFYCLAGPNQDSVTWNWKDTAVGRLTANGILVYTTNTCVNSNGTTGYFSSAFTVNSGIAVNGDAHLGYFCLSEDSNESISPFQSTGGRSWLGMQSSSTGASLNNATGGLNTSTAASFSSLWGSTVGHWVLQQNTTTQLQMFLDGASLGTSTQTNSADTGTVQLFRTSAAAYTDRLTAFAHYGGKLTTPQQLDFSKALYTFLTTMNVRPMSGTPGQLTGPTNIAPYKHVAVGTGNSIAMPVTTSSSLITGLVQCRPGSFPYSMIRVNDPNYLNMWRLEVHVGDPSPFDGGAIDRAQINLLGGQSIPWQTTGDISFSFFIEAGSNLNHSFLDLPDLHDNQGGVNSGPTHAINGTDGRFYMWIYEGGSYPQSAKFTCALGQWHHVRTTFRCDTSPNGFVRTWFDGTQIWNYSGAMALQVNAPFWWNMALYRGSASGPLAYWLANFESDASGTSPFASRPASPLPVPSLT